MKKLLAYGLAILSTGAMAAPLDQTASPALAGAWNVTFYLEPGRATGATQCIVFKLVPGTVSGVPTSGTWISPSFPGWSGQWIQVGDHVRFYGVTSGLATTESGNLENYTTMGGVSFNHFLKSNAINSSAGSWSAVRVSRCNIGYTSNASGDPSSIK